MGAVCGATIRPSSALMEVPTYVLSTLRPRSAPRPPVLLVLRDPPAYGIDSSPRTQGHEVVPVDPRAPGGPPAKHAQGQSVPRRIRHRDRGRIRPGPRPARPAVLLAGGQGGRCALH